ncbi:MAG: hypothetical protein AB7L09_21255 [Nitrospira sp.]
MWDLVGILAGLIALAGILVGIYYKGRSAGKTEIKAEQMEKSYENEVERDKGDQAVRTADDAERKRMRDKYSRN